MLWRGQIPTGFGIKLSRLLKRNLAPQISLDVMGYSQEQVIVRSLLHLILQPVTHEDFWTTSVYSDNTIAELKSASASRF